MDKIRNNDDEQSFSSHKSIGNQHPQYKTSKATAAYEALSRHGFMYTTYEES
jgi:hypothetical protein